MKDGIGPLSIDDSFCGCPENGYNQITIEKVDKEKLVDLSIISETNWIKSIEEHNIRFLFCQSSLKEEFIIKKETKKIEIDFQFMILKHEVYRFTHG